MVVLQSVTTNVNFGIKAVINSILKLKLVL